MLVSGLGCVLPFLGCSSHLPIFTFSLLLPHGHVSILLSLRRLAILCWRCHNHVDILLLCIILLLLLLLLALFLISPTGDLSSYCLGRTGALTSLLLLLLRDLLTLKNGYVVRLPPLLDLVGLPLPCSQAKPVRRHCLVGWGAANLRWVAMARQWLELAVIEFVASWAG
jgi:hypothetical protein